MDIIDCFVPARAILRTSSTPMAFTDGNRYPIDPELSSATSLFISLDGCASGTNEAAYFGYFGHDLGNWVREHLDERQVVSRGIMMRIASRMVDYWRN